VRVNSRTRINVNFSSVVGASDNPASDDVTMTSSRSRSAADIDPRRHFLVVMTRAQLVQSSLSIPIFEIRDGRHCRHIDGSSADGLRILAEGRNILYVGLPDLGEFANRDMRFVAVLESLQRLESCADLLDAIRRHLGAFEAALSSAEAA
jgi:hypothetical protein